MYTRRRVWHKQVCTRVDSEGQTSVFHPAPPRDRTQSLNFHVWIPTLKPLCYVRPLSREIYEKEDGRGRKEDIAYLKGNSYKSSLHFFTFPWPIQIVGAPPTTLQPALSIFVCSPQPSGSWRTQALSTLWCCLPTSSSVYSLVFVVVGLNTLLSQWDFFPWEMWGAFPKESQLQQSRITQT